MAVAMKMDKRTLGHRLFGFLRRSDSKSGSLILSDVRHAAYGFNLRGSCLSKKTVMPIDPPIDPPQNQCR